MRLAILATLGLTAVLTAQSPQTAELPSPFGLQMGMPRSKIGEVVKEVSRYKFQLASVSKPHSAMQTYVVTVTPKAGLCFIRALSPVLTTKTDGSELKFQFEDMAAQMEKVYGKPFLTDSLQPDSKRTAAKDWMSALLEKERTLQARWSAVDDKLPMKPTIAKIYVGTMALSPTSGHVVVEYYFDNYSDCTAEINEALKDAI
jgi:hypothetical protein